jgi:DNA repair ATPase RecN
VGPLDLLLVPVRVTRTVSRAVEDLHVVAERARRDPDPVQEVRERLDALIATGESLDGHTEELISGGRELTDAAKEIARSLQGVGGLEDSVERVAETVEPLQGLARGVGRLSRKSSG